MADVGYVYASGCIKAKKVQDLEVFCFYCFSRYSLEEQNIVPSPHQQTHGGSGTDGAEEDEVAAGPQT
ncbi:hypothetical protein CEP54_015750 [Fusarium duplospermum]|uniref:Uncharacterized protein n=1 Tax=Fusarium duplospermum TaxID=1325734 RepID=A0A428NLK4_9HYPO|nr:hypothetical protein CEP54_015750 [Fusarium duplospermum]